VVAEGSCCIYVLRHWQQNGRREVISAAYPMAFAGDNRAGAERQLREEGERALRNPHGKLLLVLHISRLPAPKSHHVRVARVLLQDIAQRHGGQVFGMRNNDLVLLCNEAGSAQSSSPYAPEGLPQTLDRLFGAELPVAGGLTSLWALEFEPNALQTALANRDDTGRDMIQGGFARSQPVGLAALQEVVAKAPLAGLLMQQTGISLSSDRHLSVAARLNPVFQQVSFDLSRLNVGPLLAEAVGDPFLSHHFAELLDARLLRLLEEDLIADGPLLHSATHYRLPVMCELGSRSIVSPAFANFARLAAASGVLLWILVAFPVAGADLNLFAHARSVLKLANARLLLNRFEAAALSLVRPSCLQADMIVLEWQSSLPFAMPDRRRLNDWAGAHTRIVLAGVESEAALAWGQTVGIGLFQGVFLDQIQAATRMQGCHSATACTLGQCRTRAAALTMPGRAGCANPALLSSGPGGPP
jgi:hypothetical protein